MLISAYTCSVPIVAYVLWIIANLLLVDNILNSSIQLGFVENNAMPPVIILYCHILPTSLVSAAYFNPAFSYSVLSKKHRDPKSQFHR